MSPRLFVISSAVWETVYWLFLFLQIALPPWQRRGRIEGDRNEHLEERYALNVLCTVLGWKEFGLKEKAAVSEAQNICG